MTGAVARIPADERPAWLPPGARRVSIAVTGSKAAVSGIERVTYALPESFNPDIETRYDENDGFRLTLDTDETTVTATIHLAGGTTAVHVMPLVF